MATWHTTFRGRRVGGYSLSQRIALIESTQEISLEGEARKNPLYAARIFLNRMGIEASVKHRVQGLNHLPDTDSVLMISAKRSTLSKQIIDALYAWVQSGGHLIVGLTAYDYNSAIDNEEMESVVSIDPLQYLLNISADPSVVSIGAKKQVDLAIKGAAYPLKMAGGAWDFHPLMSRNGFLSNDETISIKNEVFILRRQIDKGMITVVSALDFINNRNIRTADHAEILWQLVHGAGVPAEVWLIHNDKMPALWRLMWAQGWALILTLMVILILWLYRAAHRFGPLMPKASEDRRSVLEHINASGHFYWQHQQKAKLIASTREALNQRLAVTQSAWTQCSDAEKVTQLAQRLDRPENDIQRLLFDVNYGLKKKQTDEFTQLIQQLEQIRRTL
jgi:hypothetical protein